jgi:cytoskeleton protein RodZ
VSSTDRPDFELSAPSARATVGEQLKSARIQMGMTPDTVAKQLKLSARQIIALEADDISQLPAGPFLRGFVRNYARLVNLDPEHLLGQDHTRRLAVPPLDAAPPNRGELREAGGIRAEGGTLKWVIPVVLITALLVGVTWYEVRKPKPVQTSTNTPADLPVKPSLTQAAATPSLTSSMPTPASVVGSTAMPSAPISMTAPGLSPQVTEALAAPPATTVVAPSSSTAPATTTPVPAAATAAAAVTVPVSAATAKGVALELVFGEQAWAEIRDGEGNVLTSKTHAKGAKVALSGQPPFRFTVGNARNVTLTRDGTVVDLAARIGAGDVAKFTLQ